MNIPRWAPLVGLMILCSVSFTRAGDVQMTIPPGNFARTIGSGSLADPSGAGHTREDIAGQVVVAIFSAPTLSQGHWQERWSTLLADQPGTKLPDSIVLALVEDMSQAGIFQGRARGDMKKDFSKGARPLVILDETGEVFQRFGVPRNKTQILIYDKTSTLRDVEQDLGDEAATVHRIRVITRRLQAL